MARFSYDVDILRYEPILFGELHMPSQVIAAGSGGTLSGTTFTATGADFPLAGVEAGGVIHLQSADGSLDGAFEIVSIDAATELTVSVVRADSSNSPIAPPAASEISYRVCSYRPQAEDAAFRLTEFFGIQPGNPDSEIDVTQILDTSGLRKASVLTVISRIYASWANGTQSECFWKKSRLYEHLFEKARQRCRLTIDLDADGLADTTRAGGAIRLIRE
jgi:hypothetical protein